MFPTLKARVKFARAALGALFDATNWREICRRPQEPITTKPITEEVNSWDRAQLLSDSRKLYANLGPVKGGTDARSMYAVGRAWLPHFTGKDRAWGERAAEWLREEWYPIADIAGRDFQTALFLASVSVDRDGDVGVMLSEYETGFPAIQLIPAHNIGSRESYDGRGKRLESGPYKGLRLCDGVVLNDAGRAVAYNILGESSDGKGDRYVSARDLELLYDPQWIDQVRGFPAFSHAILDLKDLRTVQGYEKMACALASAIGLIEYNETGLADMDDPQRVLRGLNNGSNAEVMGKEMFGGTVKHFKAGSGQKLEAFKNDRPGDAWEKFMNRLLRNAMAGINWPYELAWDISALGGANTRFIVATAMRSIEDRQDLLKPFAKRAVGYAISKAIKSGILPPSDDWWRWTFALPPRMSVDFGRDTQAELNLYLNGLLTLTDWCAEQGKTVDEHIATKKEENEKLKAAGLPLPVSMEQVQAAFAKDTQEKGEATMAALESRHAQTLATLAAQPPPNVTITQAPINIAPPNVTVHPSQFAPQIHVEAPPAQNITVNPAAVAMSQPITVNPAAVTVQPPAVNVTVEPATVNLEQAPVVVPAPVVNIENEVNVPAMSATLELKRDPMTGRLKSGELTPKPKPEDTED
jgi:hypothetical protein